MMMSSYTYSAIFGMRLRRVRKLARAPQSAYVCMYVLSPLLLNVFFAAVLTVALRSCGTDEGILAGLLHPGWGLYVEEKKLDCGLY